MGRRVITIRLAQQEVEPDGSPCAMCRDGCYHRQFELIPVNPEGRQAEAALLVCESCMDVLQGARRQPRE